MADTEYRGSVAGIGDREERINEIMPILDAGAWDNAIGASGVLKGKISEFNYTQLDRGITIHGGIAIAHGYRGYFNRSGDFFFTQPTGSDKHYFIYAEWDFRGDIGNFKIKFFDNANSPDWTGVRQDDLSLNPHGVYQMPLYMLKMTNTGINTVTDLRIKISSGDAKLINGINLRNVGSNLQADNFIISKRHSIPLWSGDSILNSATTLPLNQILSVNDILLVNIEGGWSGYFQSFEFFVKVANLTVDNLLTPLNLCIVPAAAPSINMLYLTYCPVKLLSTNSISLYPLNAYGTSGDRAQQVITLADFRLKNIYKIYR